MKELKSNDLDWIVRTVVKRIISVHNPQYVTRSELVSEGYLLACQKIHKYNPKRGKASSFLYQAVHNGLLNYIRDISRRKYCEVPLKEEHNAVSRDTVSPIETKITLDQIEATLKPVHQSIFVLLRTGRSAVEISKILNINRVTVGRLLKELRSTYKE